MKYTNRKNLPQIIADAVMNDPYTSGGSDYTASKLIKPAYQVKLQGEHEHEITEDVADRLWSLYGHAVHYIVERGAQDDRDDAETRYYADVSDYKVSAQIDHRYIMNGDLTDWKLTAAYKIQKALKEDDADWTAQLNIQAYLLQRNGIAVNDLYIGALCRDWRKFDYLTKEGYPDQIEYIKIPKWSFSDQHQYIVGRIEAMQEAAPCTREERWQDPPTFAVMKKGGQRAAKVTDSEADAMKFLTDKGWSLDDYEIETRTSANRRCEFYCNVNQWCDFYKANYMAAEDLPVKSS